MEIFVCVTPIYGLLESISDHITDIDVKLLDEASPAHCIDLQSLDIELTALKSMLNLYLCTFPTFIGVVRCNSPGYCITVWDI